MKKNIIALLCFVSLLINGCMVRTYTVEKPRLDQDLSSGNRGQLFGESQAVEQEPRKATRQIQVVEFEMPMKDKQQAAPLLSSEAEPELSEEIAEETEEPMVVVGPGETTTVITMKEYTVRKGDTLQKISKKFYGTTRKWQKIYQANRNVLKAPDRLYPGQVIQIPLKEAAGTK
jgi:nucleoid-associated protein YgaU